MAFKDKQKSAVIAKAENRLVGMGLIDGNQGNPINYGRENEPLTSTEYSAQIQLAESIRTNYNRVLKTADELSNEFDLAEAKLKELSRKILAGALSKFGPDSDEYEQLGGKRTSDRKKPVRKNKVTA